MAAIRGDPRKTGLAAILGVLLVLMVMRSLGGGATRPHAVSAAAVSPSSLSGASSGPARSSKSRAGGNDSSASSAARPTNAMASQQQWAESPAAPISRNLFAVRLEYFPVDGLRNGAVGGDGEDDGFWGRLEKSLTLQADQRDKRENQIAHYKAKAAELRLESTMMGPQPKAMVNGELVGEGDAVASFRVLKIEARRIIVEREGIRLEIQMK